MEPDYAVNINVIVNFSAGQNCQKVLIHEIGELTDRSVIIFPSRQQGDVSAGR